jgi:hypothetical protein
MSCCSTGVISGGGGGGGGGGCGSRGRVPAWALTPISGVISIDESGNIWFVEVKKGA